MKQVLIAEDDPDLRELFARTFDKREFAVRVARDGEEAVERLREHVPDVLILDINMPKLSGFDVLAHVRSHRETHGLKVIIVTGNMVALQDGKAQYADLILAKPVSIRDLLAFTRRLLD